jgi:signal transduction histidine kinase
MLRALGFARVVAVGVAAALEVNVSSWRAVLLAMMVVYAATRLVTSRRSAMVHVLIDVGVVVVALGLTGGTVGGYSMLAAVVAFEVGLLLVNRSVLAFGGGIFLVAAAGQTSELIRGDVITSGKLAALVLIPTAIVTGVLLRRVWRVSERSAFAAVDEANRLLGSLHQVVRALPRQLDMSSVTTSMIEDVTETLGADAAAVVVGEAGLLSVRADLRMGLRVGQVDDTVGGHLNGLTAKRSTVVAVDELPPAFAAAPTPEVTVIPVSRHRDVMGFLLVAGRWSDHDIRYLQQLADEAAVALENARLFGRLRLLTVDQERDRVARELHDGVAQVMTHLRLELGLLAQGYSRDDETPEEAAARLGGSFDTATHQLRELMAQLSSTLAGGDLLGAVRQYVQDVDALGGPHVRVRFDSVPTVSGPAGRLLFDLIRSTIAIAVRVPSSTTVTVELEAWEDVLVATVVGDGTYGLADELALLGDRARDQGVLFSIEHDDEGLRRVEIACPIQNTAAPAPAQMSDGRNAP